ncbi:MAG: hypothetical protein IJ262_10605 [Clostridia bacterium]|nr:hypothetical protein [Clostridia bacterium]MBQ8029839.1 hypothetical protein [Clostridia bacterium]
MKKVFSLSLLLAVLISSFSLSSLAASEYKNKGFRFDVPDGLIQDTDFAEENGYIAYWHSEDYGFEFAIWENDGISLNLYPDYSEGTYIFNGFRRDTDYYLDNHEPSGGNAYINDLLFAKLDYDIVTKDKTYRCIKYIREDGLRVKAGKTYKYITVYIHDEEQMHFLDEIFESENFNVTTPDLIKRNITYTLISAVALALIGVFIYKKTKNKKSTKEI